MDVLVSPVIAISQDLTLEQESNRKFIKYNTLTATGELGFYSHRVLLDQARDLCFGVTRDF